jgi:hypothetical protein
MKLFLIMFLIFGCGVDESDKADLVEETNETETIVKEVSYFFSCKDECHENSHQFVFDSRWHQIKNEGDKIIVDLHGIFILVRLCIIIIQNMMRW